MSEILDRLDEMNESGVIAYDVYSELHDLVSQLEERKVGKWNILACDLYMCSKCYAKFTHKFNFCPNCGAKMRGGEKE